MSHKKAWKQFSYIKNDQWKDSQSELSESRSSRSYHFNKVRFNKSRQDDEKPTTKFGLANIIKAKDNSRQNSFMNDSRVKRGYNQFLQKIERPSLELKLSSSKNRQIELKMKKFSLQIRKIHDGLRQTAQSLLSNFEKIKQELQINLINMIDNLLKSSNNLKLQQTVHEIIHNSFLQIRKNISVLPYSMTHLNNSQEDSIILKNQVDNQFDVRYEYQIPSSPLLKAEDVQSISKSRSKINSNFAPKEHHFMSINEFNMQLPLTSNQKPKIRPQTQRKKHYRVSSFDKEVDVKGLQTLEKSRNAQNPKHQTERYNMEKASNIQNIISQMRSILNQ